MPWGFVEGSFILGKITHLVLKSFRDKIESL